MNQIISQIAIQSTLTFTLTMPIASIAGKQTTVKFSISTHHITVIRHNKMTSSKRTSESERTPLIQMNKRETQQSGDLLFVCENGKATHNGREVYSLTEGRMNTSSLARSISLAYSMSTHPTPASPRMVVMRLLTASLDCVWNNAVSACSRDTKQSLESTQSEEETAMNPPSLPS